jgi:hypothetical protein
VVKPLQRIEANVPRDYIRELILHERFAIVVAHESTSSGEGRETGIHNCERGAVQAGFNAVFRDPLFNALTS